MSQSLHCAPPLRWLAIAIPSRFVRAHLLWPLLAFALLCTWLTLGDGDMWLARHLFDWQGETWSLQQHALTEVWIHQGGRLLSGLLWLGVVLMFVFSLLSVRSQRWRRPLLYLALCVLSSVALVSGLKRSLVVDCPWNVHALGGERPYLTVFETRPAEFPREHCFPAGHASAGYAWLALYFAAFASPRWRRLGLVAGLGMGLLFGIGQQLRGAHFASHDLVTALICWSVALAWRPLLAWQKTPPGAQA